MKICIVGSMQFSDKMMEVAEELTKVGHEPMVSLYIAPFLGKSAEEQEKIKLQQKYEDDAMRKDFENQKQADALLVLNMEKHEIPGYIGGNTFLEMGMAYMNRQPIYLYNPIPEMPHYKTEIIAMKPVVLNGDLGGIK